MRTLVTTAVSLAVLTLCAWALGEVVIETVSVGNPGNGGENSGESEPGGIGPDRVCGAVDYVYSIGKFEVTAGQYTAFLNAVAATDTYELYDARMWTHEWGCRIQRSGSPPDSYTYSIDPNWADRPVNYVSWGDAARFANWLHNGQPTGAQGASTTEDGSYYLNGATTNEALQAVTRKAGATWVIPSEDEWYKAAYHKNNGLTADYWEYPTSSDVPPSNVLGEPTDPGNNATFYADAYTIGAPHYRTEVGDHEISDSPYGTLDQGANVWEWNEAIMVGMGGASIRGQRGGSFYQYISDLAAPYRANHSDLVPTNALPHCGFRVAEIPDCNGNGIADHCDLDCGPSGGFCDVPGCGLSLDVNDNGVPDECEIGDMNCDGVADIFDIDAFVLAITSASQYVLQYPQCDLLFADCNQDGYVDVFDIDAFVAILVGT